MTPDLLLPGHIIEVSLPPCLGGWGLAGTHPLVILAFDQQRHEVQGLACTSRSDRKEPTYFLPRDASDLPRDSYVLVGSIRQIEKDLWQRARLLGRVPSVYLNEIRKKARPAWRRQRLGGYLC